VATLWQRVGAADPRGSVAPSHSARASLAGLPIPDLAALVSYFAHARSNQNGRPNLALDELRRTIFAPLVA